MASIQSLGAGSGLLTNDLVDSIVKAERDATDRRLQAKRSEVEAKVSALGSVRSAVDLLRSAARAVAQPVLYGQKSATSSRTDLLSASATSNATQGTHSVRVNRLAAAQSLASKRFASVNDAVGTGTLTIRFGTTTFDGNGAYSGFTPDPDRVAVTVTVADGDDTLSGLRDAINAAGVGVTASIVNDGGGFRLVLAASASGAAGSMEIVAAEGSEPGLAAFAFSAGAATPDVNMTQTVAAQDAELVVNGLTVTRASNTVTGVVDGVTLELVKAEAASTLQVTVGADRSRVAAALENYVERFNNLKTLTDGLTAYDPETQEAGLLLGDASVRTLVRQLRAVTSATVSGLPAGARRTLVEVGIRTGEDGRLLLDTSVLDRALQSDAVSVASLFAATGRATDSGVSVADIGTAVAGSYDVVVARHASAARLAGAAVPGLGGPVVIDGSNDLLKVHVDGNTSGDIVLAHGTYADGAALAQEIEARINADAVLSAAGSSVAVSYDATSQRLFVDSLRVGGASTVGIVAVDSASTATLGLSVVAAERNVGLNVLGRINGVVATGSGNTLKVPAGELTARSGFFAGTRTDVFGSIVVDAGSDTLQLTVDGVTTGVLTLTHGTYAGGAALAAELQARIDADAALDAADKRITVSYDADSRAYTLISGSAGASSRVDVASIEAGAATLLGLAAGNGVAGHAASSRGNAAAGITVAIDGGATGARGSVVVVRGIMDQLGDVLGRALAGGGALEARIDGLDATLADIDAESVRLERRIEAFEKRLRQQFTTADALISQLNGTSSFLTQQLQYLPSLFDRKD
jgi:flagellar hook-associated protein 2